MDDVVVDHARVLEDDRPDRRLAPPLPRASGPACRGARSVSSVSAQVGSAPSRRSSAGKRETRRRRRRSAGCSGSAPSSSQRAARSRRGSASSSRPSHSRDVSSRSRSRSICVCELVLRARAPPPSSSSTRLPASRRRGLLGLDLVASALGVARARMPLAERARRAGARSPGDEAAELLLDRLGLPDQHLEDAVLGPLRVDEVVAAHLGARAGACGRCGRCAAPCGRVPGHVEVEQVRAVGLEVQALAGGVGGDQDAQRVLRRVGVERALDLLARRRRPSPPWKVAMRSSAAVGRRRSPLGAAARGSAWCRRTR